MIIWPLCGILVFALMSATGQAAEEGSGGDRAKEPSRTVEPKKKQDTDEPKKKQDTDEPKKKQDTDAKTDSNGKQGADKSAAEEKARATDEKAKDDKAKDDKAKDEKAKDEKAKSEDKAKTADEKPKVEEAKPEEPAKKPVASLNLAIKLALMADPQLFPLDIEVEMDKGKAILSGSVPTEEDKGKVAEIASKIDGVETVVNKLTVTPALKDKLAKKHDESIAHVVRDRLSRSETLKAVGFDVKSENGIVYLSGKTRFQVIALEAAEAARQVPGVRAVDTAGVQLIAKE
jgi:hyperosmotically inducible periplasmic protein